MEDTLHNIKPTFNSELKLKGFNVYKIESSDKEVKLYSRKDFYKICLNTGKNIIHYADKSFETTDTVLFFGNPHIPYSWEIASPDYTGYACLFSEEFIKSSMLSETLLQSPLFKIGGTPILILDDRQKMEVRILFEKMITEQNADYTFKDDLIRNYIQLIIHEAMKMQPSENFSSSKNGHQRIAAVFLELLERQFPVETSERPVELKTAQDYANALSVHINYLNRAVKDITGKTTTTHISERIISEAKALLQHTDWNIAEIAYALGYDYPTYFNNFFKKQTGENPRAFRLQKV